MAKELNVITQGVKGGKSNWLGRKGRVRVLIGDEYEIEVDAFKGMGDTYQEREEPEITVYDSGELVFKGDFCELVSALLRGSK